MQAWYLCLMEPSRPAKKKKTCGRFSHSCRDRHLVFHSAPPGAGIEPWSSGSSDLNSDAHREKEENTPNNCPLFSAQPCNVSHHFSQTPPRTRMNLKLKWLQRALLTLLCKEFEWYYVILIGLICFLSFFFVPDPRDTDSGIIINMMIAATKRTKKKKMVTTVHRLIILPLFRPLSCGPSCHLSCFPSTNNPTDQCSYLRGAPEKKDADDSSVALKLKALATCQVLTMYVNWVVLKVSFVHFQLTSFLIAL